MSRKRGSSRNSSLTKKQMKEVKKIASQVLDEEIENKRQVTTEENIQLYHNKPNHYGKLLTAIGDQGVEDGFNSSSGSGSTKVRLGDRVTLKNINLRFWLSNKLDRPNVIYKGVLYWYPLSMIPGDDEVYATQSNKILDRYNDKAITVLDTFIIKPQAMFLNGTEKFEHSYLATLNKSWKSLKVEFDNNTSRTKDRELGFSIVCYDAYGTLQTDNIASFAYNMQVTFQDA